MSFITDFFTNNFDNCVWLAVLLVSVLPTLESKIAVPLAMNSAIWGSNAISPLLAFLFAFIGSIIPSYLIIFITRKIKQHTTIFLHSKFIQKYAIKSAKIDNKSSIIKYIALACFVSVPIPLTGVWSGSLIAGLSNLNPNYAFISICIGACISAGAVTLLCSVFNNSVSSIFIISLVILILFLFFEFFLSLIKTHKKSGI